MGAEGSKSSSRSNNGQPNWLTADEIKKIQDQIDILSKHSGAVDVAILKSEAQKLINDITSQKLTEVIQEWGGRASSAANIPCSQLLKTFIGILNPDTDVQADLLLSLAGSKDGTVHAKDLIKAVASIISGYLKLPSNKINGAPNDTATSQDTSVELVSRAFLQDLLFDGVSFKQSIGKDLPESPFTKERVARWLAGQSALYFVIQLTVIRKIVSPGLSSMDSLLPKVTKPKNDKLPLSVAELLLLNTALPPALRCEWRLLFSNVKHGDSFSSLTNKITNAGPTVVLIEDEEGHRFGGFASASWEIRPQFHGTAECFLFSLCPSAGIFLSTGYNSNFQYLNYLENNTMPNGLGMGGREELFGFFLSSNFGECQVAPSCTTFSSPPLCPNQQPKAKYITVFGVGEEPKSSDDEEEGTTQRKSALDRNHEARAMLDLIGRERASDGLREPEPDSD